MSLGVKEKKEGGIAKCTEMDKCDLLLVCAYWISEVIINLIVEGGNGWTIYYVLWQAIPVLYSPGKIRVFV